MPGSMTPQQMSSPMAGRARTVGGDDPGDTAAHADRLWAALVNVRTGDRPSTRARTEDAVFRFYLPMARTLARSSDRYPPDPEGAEQAAELGLAQAVLAWRRPTGEGFDRAARAAILHHLQQGRRTTRHLSRQGDRPAGRRTGPHHPGTE